ncbi:MAG: glycosyl hydrolase family 28 protein [Victivallaceae bacterium]|nr:glycosyl hydrolase family 28 protein [Victivallaceae bacterium]
MDLYADVKTFGAVGDGVANDTAAIQRAIDSGRVAYLPAGRYRSGTIHLRSHTGILLGPGAVLTASPDAADYNADDYCAQNRVLVSELVSGRHLISAVEVEDILIGGEGVIDGMFRQWMNEPDETLGVTPPFLKRSAERPGQMVFLCECTKVRIRDVELTNAPYWHCYLHGCEDVRISGLRIFADPGVINNDGIDLDACRHVVVSDCIIRTADDCLTLRGLTEPLKKKRACEYIAVTNCVFSSSFANAIRVGVGDGEIRHALFSNISISESRTGVCIVSRYWPGEEGVEISDLTFDHMQIHARRPFNLKLDNSRDLSPVCARGISDITFSNITGSGEFSCYFTGTSRGRLDNIRLCNVQLRYRGKGVAPDRDENGKWGCSSTDAVFELEYATNFLFDRVNVLHENSAWAADLRETHCRRVVQKGLES